MPLLGLVIALVSGADWADLDRARTQNEYRLLLTRIEVPSDQVVYSSFYDSGYLERPQYAGFVDLPSGYWVYVAPHWYIWGSKRNDAARPWDAQQATGAPNATRAGSIATSWASLTQDGHHEWLFVEFPEVVQPMVIRVCLLYTSPSPRDRTRSRMPSSA